MKKIGKKGFTLIELLVVISIIALLAAGGFASYGKIMPGIRAKSLAKTGREIWNFLNVYATDNDQRFPEAQSFSNDAFRELYKAGLLDNEKAFYIPNDPWHNNAIGGNRQPDNDIGVEPDYTQALQTGECAWAYVTGHDTASNSTLPIMANAFSESIGVYSPDKSKKGGVFEGKRAVWVTVAGAANAVEIKSSDPRIMERKGGRDVDVFSSDFGTNPSNVLNPEG